MFLQFYFISILIAEDLALIGKCLSLKKLTLGYFHIENGHFLEAVYFPKNIY